ncbi:helix-turn-helix domain-containing protein [Nitratireductor sp. StC3]|uniref:winged helix-turn-helix domain-containing protein n=1 Tax=Nitratireductor sp. StC3 TaxID=2126741 RepID=UPI000D0C99B0|nr:helix-turn-helix domain-containing protein [Nitratireductor sp. StC3]PSM18237.1 heavy metal resistance protein CzcR [Nitratireductor sp. StC3]
MNWEARARELQKQVDDLEFMVDNLQSALTKHASPYIANLTGNEAKIAQLLRERSPNAVDKSAIFDLLYAFRHDDETPESKIVDVYICKARRKLSPLGIEIETVWGRGYLMPDTSAKAWDVAVGRAAA